MANKKSYAVHIVFSIVALLGIIWGLAPLSTVNAQTVVVIGKPVSDDFDSCVLNSQIWEFSDPLENTQFSVDGSVVTMAMTAGEEHDLFEGNNSAPRLTQRITDEDFTAEVKFESAVTQKFQIQGILIEEDSDNFLRVDFFHDGTDVILFSAGFTNGSKVIDNSRKLTDVPASPAGYFLRVFRSGDRWLPSYSYTGAADDWTSVGAFDFELTAAKAGIFGGNVTPGGGQPAPAHTLIADYFFEANSPISPEDDNTTETLTTAVVGQGTVSPESGTFGCGDQTLTATPAEGWRFAGWSGDLTGTTNPATLAMDGALSVTATFEELTAGKTTIYLPYTAQ